MPEWRRLKPHERSRAHTQALIHAGSPSPSHRSHRQDEPWAAPSCTLGQEFGGDTRAGRGNLNGKEMFSLWMSHQAQSPELVTKAGAEGEDTAGRGIPQAEIIGEKP